MFQGIFAPIPTPFIDEEIAYDKLGENLAKWGNTGLSGIVVLGSNGEQPNVDEEEKVELWAYARKHFPKDKLVIAGTGCESTRATIRVTKKAADVGADAALIISPHYFKANMTDAALEQYYKDVADASPIPILLYNMPANTGLNMTPSLVKRLCHHPNIKGIKDSSPNIVQISEILRDVPQDFAVFAGSASFLMPSLVMGASGGTLALANVAPDLCVNIYDFVRTGQFDKARAIQKSILRLNNLVTAKYGVAGLKAALDMIGYFGGLPRRPILPLGEREKEEIKVALEELNLV
ncbi:MAG TPA: dihydrodipicolinate synthase family protein [Bacillota bacterium]|mgnify:FL=1|nr:dihydrodipicolinate synthase family protein [Candidatus Fermentithermobacillaceae bacterium]HOB30830.1 dihydrodipicolinate synthase family protein [Bacillota bacterium]HOK64603.1 dihydrodipicolinate synthase family protein [Bacillota bacterium]HPP60941.1 dihydrodipicolinate synthase family protein [Bacillota bacterium]HPZ78394.1 dihydrodipicolinate synthase family protein [Bacillota bacterium]